MFEVPVLIVGGGPVGLTASIQLSRLGIRNLLVERHPGVAKLPKARGINARTMEMYRQMGLEPAIRDAGLAPHRFGLIVWTESLAGTEIERRVPGRASPRNMAMTPTPNCLCAQDDLEPVLHRYAEAESLADIRFSNELTECAPDAEGVTATIRDRTTGAAEQIRAQWLIACDGAQSRVRRQLGVRMLGEEKVYDSVNILFRANLSPWTAHRPAALYFVEQPDLRGTFLTINGEDRWSFLIHSLKQYGWTPADFTDSLCTALIRKAAGLPDLDVQVLGISAWEASAIVAEHYRFGRIFLAGDAAHEVPPTGGFGLNTGVQDVQNLTWKLAAVLRNEAGEALLDSYHAERQPLADLTARTSLANALSMGRTAKQNTAVIARPEFLNEQGLIFGQTYESGAVIADGTPIAPLDERITTYDPHARPGCRAPQHWLARGETQVSTIDLFGQGFVLLAAPGGEAWVRAAAGLAPKRRVALTAYRIGADLTDPDDGFAALYGLDPDGAVLVRPDGYIAWRSRSGTADPERRLAAVLGQMLAQSAAGA